MNERNDPWNRTRRHQLKHVKQLNVWSDRGRKGDQVDVVRKCMMRQDFNVMGMGKLYWKFLGKVDKNTNFNVSDHKKSIVKPFY